MASTTTQDHDFIREWADKRGAKPAEVASTEEQGKPGILRLEFPAAPNANDDALKEIGWEEFFEKFDESGLEFLYQEETAEGELSNFNKLVYPDPESKSGKRLLKKTAGKKTSGKKAATAKGAKKTISLKASSKSAVKKAAATKTVSKKAASKKSASKKTASKKTVLKKVASKKGAATKAAVNASAAKKSPGKQAGKKAAAKKGTS